MNDYPHYDLHCHSSASDGMLSPSELLSLAQEKGLRCLALTDHDTVAGVSAINEMQSQGEFSDLTIINGAEFTCLLDRQVLHVVGLNLNLASVTLHTYLQQLDQLRYERAERIAHKLVKKKLPNILPQVLEEAAGGQLARPHFARVLCRMGVVQTQSEAFDKYLGRGKAGDVSVQWPDVEHLLAVIRESGGLAILAHPTKYNLTMSKLRKVIAAFKDFGGHAVEISYPGINKEQQNIIKYEALKHELMVSAGSDFHDPGYRWTDLGSYPQVPEGVPHVLDVLIKGIRVSL